MCITKLDSGFWQLPLSFHLGLFLLQSRIQPNKNPQIEFITTNTRSFLWYKSVYPHGFKTNCFSITPAIEKTNNTFEKTNNTFTRSYFNVKTWPWQSETRWLWLGRSSSFSVLFNKHASVNNAHAWCCKHTVIFFFWRRRAFLKTLLVITQNNKY